MFSKFSQVYRGLRLKNQIYVFQSIIVFIIFSLWISLIVLAILQFTNLITSRQMTQILMKPFIHQVNTTISQTAQITLRVQQFSVMLEQFNNDLFDFIKKNKVQFGYQIENCQNGSDYLYKYTFCQQYFQADDVADVNNFVSFQNTLIPLWLTKETINIFTFYDNSYYSQMPGQYQQKFPNHLETIQLIMNQYSINYFYNTTYIDDKAYIQTYFLIRGTKIITGSTVDYNFDQLKYFFNRTEIQGVRVYVLDTQGNIYLSNQNLDNNIINKFQDPSITGFNQTQYSRIQEEIKAKNNTIFLTDITDKKFVIVSRSLTFNKYQYYIFFIIDISIVDSIQEQFKYQVDSFQYQIFLNGALALAGAILVSVLLQQIMIRQLNSQISQLQRQAVNHISNRKHFFTDIINKKRGQGQIQRLNKAFCDLIYSNKKQNSAIPKKFYQDITNEYFLKNLTISDQMILDDIRENLQMIL